MIGRTPRPPRPTWFETHVLAHVAAWRTSTARHEADAAKFLAELDGDTRRDPYAEGRPA